MIAALTGDSLAGDIVLPELACNAVCFCYSMTS